LGRRRVVAGSCAYTQIPAEGFSITGTRDDETGHCGQMTRIGEYVADHGMEGDGEHRAARDLLMGVAPRLRGQAFRIAGEETLAAAVRAALNLEQSVLPVQGPPGAGKIYTGARMICALAKDGRSIGITANSHKVIRNLLDEVVVAARSDKISVGCIQKVSDKEVDRPPLRFTTDNANFLDALHSDCRVGGATAWFWVENRCREQRRRSFHRRSRADVARQCLGRTQAAKSIVSLEILVSSSNQSRAAIRTASTSLLSTTFSAFMRPCRATAASF
jgi:hypothetical protein